MQEDQAKANFAGAVQIWEKGTPASLGSLDSGVWSGLPVGVKVMRCDPELDR